jgi:hypothetical protein
MLGRGEGNERKGKRREGEAGMDYRRILPTGILPTDYRMDKADADVAVLRRQDGSFVAAFSALGATGEAIRRAAEEDRVKGERSHRLTTPV